MNTLKKIGIATLAIVIIAVIVIYNQQRPEDALASRNYSIDNCYLNDSEATSSPTYLTTTGDDQIMYCNVEGAKSIDFNLRTTASSTATVYNWTYEFADGREVSSTVDCNATPLACDWFGETSVSSNSLIATSHGSTTVTHTLTPQTTTAQNQNILLSPIGARYLRVTFSATGANGSLWAQGVSNTEY